MIICNYIYSDKLVNLQVNCNCLIFPLGKYWEECVSSLSAASLDDVLSQSELTTSCIHSGFPNSGYFNTCIIQKLDYLALDPVLTQYQGSLFA